MGGVPRTGMFNPFDNYANQTKGEVQRYLARNNSLRERRYRIAVKVWVTPEGRVQRAELVGSSGDGDTDDAISESLKSFAGFSSPPPPNMPQPIHLRIVTGA